MTERRSTTSLANLSRRRVLTTTAAAGLGLAAPAIISRKALSSSGELNLYTWSDYVYPGDDRVLRGPDRHQAQPRDLRLQRRGAEPPARQPAAGLRRGHAVDRLHPGLGRAGAAAAARREPDQRRRHHPLDVGELGRPRRVQGGQRYTTPFNWGTEALCIDTRRSSRSTASSASARSGMPETRGKVTVRAHSGLLGIGLYLDSIGEVPSERMRVTYDRRGGCARSTSSSWPSPSSTRPWIVQFWSNAQETEAAFLQNGAVIGQTWDGPAMRMRSESGGRYTYLAPKEGALTWMDSMGIPVGAANVEQAYAWMNWYYQPSQCRDPRPPLGLQRSSRASSSPSSAPRAAARRRSCG
jgi:spermidine/putrescine transport system substrate-binding protein